MTRAELKQVAKEQISGKIWLIFAMTLIVAIMGFACGLIPFIGAIGAIIVSSAFVISFCTIYLKLANYEEISVNNIFDGFKITGKAIWLNIMIAVFTFLWSLLFVIPGIIKAYSYSMSYFILAEHPEYTAQESLEKSKEIMNGHKMDLFVLQLSFILWDILVGITFGIAAIYVIPYKSATIANFYNSIKDEGEKINIEG